MVVQEGLDMPLAPVDPSIELIIGVITLEVTLVYDSRQLGGSGEEPGKKKNPHYDLTFFHIRTRVSRYLKIMKTVFLFKTPLSQRGGGVADFGTT